MLTIIFAIFILFPSLAHSALTTIEGTARYISLNGKVDVLRDPTRTLSFEDISDPKRAQEFKTASGRFAAGFTRDVVWLRFTLQKANNDLADEWLLEIYPPFLDYVTLYSSDAPDGLGTGRSYRARRTGRLLPISDREIRERHFVFPLRISDDQPHTYYVRLDTTGTMFADLKVWQPRLFYEHSSNVFLMQGGFLGIAVLLAILNLIFFFILRDRLFIYYSMTVIPLTVVLSLTYGIIPIYIFPETPSNLYPMTGISISALYIAGTLLLEAVITIDTGKFLRWSFSVIRAFSACCILIILLDGYKYVAGLLQIVGLYICIVALYMSAMAIYRRMPFAKLYGITFIIYYVGGLMITVRNINPFGLSRPFMDDIFQIGAVLHMLLIQIVIAHRFQRVEQERKEAKKKVELEAIKTQRLESLSFLAGGIAHDFNNMLTVILSTITLAKMYAEDNNKIVSKINEAEAEIMHARGLTNQLLTFSRGGAPVKSLSSISDIVHDTVEFSLKGSNIGCEFIMDDHLWDVEIDRVQMSQVISNLTINAKQSMSEGGKIAVAVENSIVNGASSLPLKDGKYIKISIVDTGEGIKAEDLQKIFDPFFTTKKQGKGIGLAVSYSIVKQHSGHIGVQSSIGKGSNFTVYLPASDKSYAGESPCDSLELKGFGRLLIMDDDKTLLNNVAEMLGRLGYDVETAINGEEAISIYQKAYGSSMPFDLIIMDVTIIGGMGARQCIEEIKKIDPDVSAIVMSGYAEDVTLAEYSRYGFKDFLSKPFTIQQAYMKIQKAMKG